MSTFNEKAGILKRASRACCFAQPDKNPPGIAVNSIHLRNLLFFLAIARLINANRVDPDICRQIILKLAIVQYKGEEKQELFVRRHIETSLLCPLVPNSMTRHRILEAH